MSVDRVLVPKVPTQEMLDAVTAADQGWPFNDSVMRSVYGAMIDAAPSPPVSVEQAGKATAEMVEAALRALNIANPHWFSLDEELMERAINAALQLKGGAT